MDEDDLIITNATNGSNNLPLCNVCSVSGPPDPAYLRYNLILIGFMMPTVGFLGFVGNGLSAFVYSRPRMRSSTNLYLCALGFSDIFVIMTALFLFFIEGMRRYGPTISYLYARGAPYFYPSGMTAQTCSVYFTVAAAVDCFIIIVLPSFIGKKVCTPQKAKFVILGVIVFGVLYNVTHCFEIDIIDCIEAEWNVTSLQVCPTQFRNDPTYFTIYYTYLYTIVMAAGPLLLLIIINTIIVLVLMLRPKQHSIPDEQSDEGGGGDTITLILVVFLFIFCNSLALIINFLETTIAEKLGPIMNYLVDVSNLLVVCNSSANFIIYYAFGEGFRKTLRFYVCGRSRPKPKPRCSRLIRNKNGTPHDNHINCAIPLNMAYSSEQEQPHINLLEDVKLLEDTKAAMV